jgi:site-specific recombinase XerD
MRVLCLTKLETILKEMYEESQEGQVFDYKPDTITQKFKKYLRESEVNKDIHFHNLRDTFASHLIMQGVDLLTVSKYLGHSDIRMTQRYVRLSTKNLESAVRKLDR